MSLLTIVNNAAVRLGIDTAITSVVGSTDATAIQMLALAQEEGKALARRHSWQNITKEKTFTSTAAAVQASSVASDFDRFVDGSFFNRTDKRPVEGPLTPQEWQFAQAVVATTIVEAFRMRGGDILITPTPADTSTTYAYEYISTNWCSSSGGTHQSSWAADSDSGLLNEELMTLGIMWRYAKAKGYDYGELFRTYELQCMSAASRDGGNPTLYAGKRGPRQPGIYVPDGNWLT
jgi:hypothetical protein